MSSDVISSSTSLTRTPRLPSYSNAMVNSTLFQTNLTEDHLRYGVQYGVYMYGVGRYGMCCMLYICNMDERCVHRVVCRPEILLLF